MNVGEGDAAEKVVRMMLTGGEVAVRLTGSALKNGIALLLALYKDHKKVYGKTSFVRLLKQTRDIRTFTMTPAQFRQFQKYSIRYKLLYAAVQDRRRRDAPMDVILPATEIERANTVFERIRYAPQEPDRPDSREDSVKKKELRSGRGSRDTRDSSSTRDSAPRTTSEKPSVEEKLKGFKAERKNVSAPARAMTKSKKKGRVK
jgi:hypothetical protein